mgnify:CR=1 FL=1
MKMNNVHRHLWPELDHGDIDTPDRKDLGDYVKQLSGAGIDLTDDQTASQLRRYAGLPDDVEDHEH